MTLNNSLKTAVFCAFAVSTLLNADSSFVSAADLGIKGPDQQKSIQAIVSPGQKLETYVEIVNTNKQEGARGTIQVKDLLVQDDGGFNVIGTDQQNTGVATWVEVSEPVVSLDPAQIKKVPITINVPSDAKSGEYVAGLTIMDNQPESEMGNIRIVSRVAIQMHLAIVGDLKINSYIEDLGVVKMAGKDDLAGLSLNTKNEGNLATLSATNMTIKGPEGYRLDKNFDSYFFPSDKNYSKPLQIDYANWKNGSYEMTIDMVNNPINRVLKQGDVKYIVKKQHIVFTFDYKDGVLSNLKIKENKKMDTLEEKQVVPAKKNNLLNIILIIISLGVLVMLVKSLYKNKKYVKKEFKSIDASSPKSSINKDALSDKSMNNEVKMEIVNNDKSTDLNIENKKVEQKEKVEYTITEEEKTPKQTVIGQNKNKTIYDSKTDPEHPNKKISL